MKARRRAPALDPATYAQGMSRPGMDPRQWVSYGLVDREHGGQRSVEFTEEYGPLVRVTLQPSEIPVTCRVAGGVAGNGEGDWFPFLEQDEVLVAVPQGDERSGCCIIGRLNQGIDRFPTVVAGAEVAKNNFGFRRLRTPYIIETASSYLLRSATTGAFFGIDQAGTVTMSNSDGAYFSLSGNFLGMQSGDGSTRMQIDVDAKQVRLEAGGGPGSSPAILLLDASASRIQVPGTLAIGTGGGIPSGHAVTAEQVVALIANVVAALATAGNFNPLGPLGLPAYGLGAVPLIDTLMVGAVGALGSPVPFSGIPGGEFSSLIAVFQTLQGVMGSPLSVNDPTGLSPGFGRPSFLL